MMFAAGIIAALQKFFGLVDGLSPALVQVIEALVPQEQQAVMMHRMGRCRRYCRRNHLLPPMIINEVAICFPLLQPADQKRISDILIFELQPRDLQNFN